MTISDRISNSTAVLAFRLSRLGFMELFQRLNRKEIDNIWSEASARDRLEKIVSDEKVEMLARFLASEILFLKERNFPPPHARSALSFIYAAALAGNFTRMANPWGLPGMLDGETGQHIVKIGQSAVPELAKLLDDGSPVIYGGSSEATFGNHYGYRVKDLAAFFISTIKNIRFPVDEDPKVRDIAIKNVKAALSGGGI